MRYIIILVSISILMEATYENMTHNAIFNPAGHHYGTPGFSKPSTMVLTLLASMTWFVELY